MRRWIACRRVGGFVAHFVSSLYTQDANVRQLSWLISAVSVVKQYAGRVEKFHKRATTCKFYDALMKREPQAAIEQLTIGQRTLLRHKIHVRANALARSRGDVQQRLPSVWQAAVEIATLLRGLPEDAFLWWAEQPTGHILLTADESGYSVDALTHGGDTLRGVALIPLRQILDEPAQAAITALLPLDHLLGCGGETDRRWLSEGGGVHPRWARIGGQIADLFALGYGLSEESCRDPHLYLAEGLWMAIHDRRRLNTADPKLERLLKSSLLSAPFWRRFVKREVRSEK
jgi:hypothetical protein